MRRFHLRYRGATITLPLGEFSVGRSSGCDLTVGDGLVSRRHAVFRVSTKFVTVEDNASRNGVTVNGERIEAATTLRDNDSVGVGAESLVLLCEQKQPIESTRHTLTELPNLSELSKLSDFPPISDEEEDEETQITSGIGLVLKLAEKAISLKRFGDAERILTPQLIRVIKDGSWYPESSKPPSDDSAPPVTYALNLAEGLKSSRWITWVFEYHASTAQMMDSETIDRMHALIRSCHYQKVRPARAYLDVLNAINPNSVSDRFSLRRIEALVRVIEA